MLQFVCAGRALYMSLPHVPDAHLWFILTDPDPRIVMAMMRSSKTFTDKTVTLQPGDHPFVKHESNIDYGVACIQQSRVVDSAIRRNQVTLHQDMSAQLLETVRKGLLHSSRTNHDVRRYCAERLGRPDPFAGR